MFRFGVGGTNKTKKKYNNYRKPRSVLALGYDTLAIHIYGRSSDKT